MHTDGVTVFSQWPLQHFFDYIFSFDSIVSNLQYPRECQGELWIIVRGDGLPCGGESWCQMSISFANHGHLARTLSYHWTVVQAILHRSGCHIALQGTAEPDGEETWCLLKVWEDLAPLLGGDMRMHTAVVAMYMLLGDMYGTMFEEGALQAPEVAQAFQRWVCPAIRSPYINWMLHDATVTIQAILLIRPYGLGMFSGDLLEGSNRVLKDIWSSFCDRGGGAGTLVSRRIKMLRQVNERLFLYFEVPRWNGNSRSNLCNAQKLADEVRAYFADEELW